MELTPGQAYLFENLKIVSKLTDTVDLCLYRPKCKVYITKAVDPEDVKYYDIISGIDHPNLAKIEFVAYTGTEYRAVREYVSGECLSDILDSGRTFDGIKTAQIAYEIASGLNALHTNSIVHRDINPNNIIITTDGTAKIIDYGIARSYKEFKSKDTVIVGTPGYAAPEQFGFTQSDGRTDIYALGVLINVMLCGKTPQEELAKGSLKKVIRKCIEIDSAKRYTNMTELMRELHRITGAGKIVRENEISDTLLDKIMYSIPGIRSGKIYIIIPALIGYALEIYSVVNSYATCEPTLSNYILCTMFAFLAFIMPLFCFHNFLDVWNRLPFTRGASRGAQRAFFYTVGVLSIMVGFYCIGTVFASPQ